MSKIDELIEKLCPNGVEYKSLAQLCGTITTGKLNANAMVENGIYPFYTCDFTPFRINEYAFDEEAILISGNGSQIGHINYYKGKFNAYQRTYVLYNFIEINVKFLLHYLSGYLKNYILIHCKKGSVPYITLPILQNFSVPVPPMEVQCEIVHILDDFTELSKELSKELKDRQKQFAYYRDKLLNNNRKMISLKNIIRKSCSGGTPLKSNNKYYENGNIPWLRTQDVKFNEITQVTSFITEKAVKETAARWIPENCVIVAISGASAGRCAINKFKTTTNQHCLNMEIDECKAIYKYVFYCICSKYDELLVMKQGARGDLNSSKILSLKIPLPSINEQQQIANILDRFDKLCNDKSEGLPAEIELRQKQYEYYRDKLLTFKEIKVNEE